MQHSLTYLSTIDRYLGKFGIYTLEEVTEADHEEARLEESRTQYNLLQLLEIFPQAKAVAKRKLREDIKQWKLDIIRAEEKKISFNNTILSRAKPENKWFFMAYRDVLLSEVVGYEFDPEYTGIYNPNYGPGIITISETIVSIRERQIKKAYFTLSALEPAAEGTKGKITEHDIARAKTVPIENYYLGHLRKAGHTLVGKCPFHKEKTPSFTIYPKENRWHCYGGCNEGGDVIDFTCKSKNIKFLEAVKFLLNK